jgi:hypothetical protein
MKLGASSSHDVLNDLYSVGSYDPELVVSCLYFLIIPLVFSRKRKVEEYPLRFNEGEHKDKIKKNKGSIL